MADPLRILPSKLSAPALSNAHLERARLAQRMEAPGPVRVIVLRAPAGFGKTTAMQQYAGRCAATGTRTAWLNLDSADDDPGRFLVHLEAALTQGGAIAPAAEAQAGVLGLVQRVASATEPFELFLDDFESIQSSAVLDLLRQLVDSMPAGWRIVIGSRTVPSLGLGRLRAHGRVIEIGMEQLRFSPEEASEFLCVRRGLQLGPELVAKLHAATEGWVTALWLASVALEGQADPATFLRAFSGGHAAIAEYLAEDVLAKQDEPVRDFLLRISVLAELNAPLCDAVLQASDSDAMLAHLERANLFLVPMDAPRGSYRLHSLVAEFLRTQLSHRHPGLVGTLHRRAAQWYEAQARPVPAIEHALRARDTTYAVQLLEAHAPALMHGGRFRLLARWLGGLAAAQFERHPMLAVVHAWSLAFTHRYQESLVLLRALEARGPSTDAALEQELTAHRLAMRPMLLGMMDLPESVALAISNHAQLDPRYVFPYSLLTNTLAIIHAGHDRVEVARTLLEAARRSHHRIGSTFSMVVAECIEGAISLRRGRLQDAIARFRVAMNNMTLESSGRTDGNPNAAVQLAEALYEAGQLDKAERILVSSMPLVREVGQVAHIAQGHITLARIAWHRGEPERAFGILGELEYLGHQDETPRLAAAAELERSRLALLRNDMKGATLYLRRAADPKLLMEGNTVAVPLHDVESLELARLRLRLRTGKAAEALEPIALAFARARDKARHRLALVLALLQAEAFERAGRGEEARALVARCLALAAPEGIVQPFADEGPVVADLARAWCRAATAGKLALGVASGYVELLDRACAAAGSNGDGEAAGAPDALSSTSTEGSAIQALTFREIHVLKLLARGQSNGAIAQALFVSENTVRTHLRNIFAKLGARNRVQAANLARQHRLIDGG